MRFKLAFLKDINMSRLKGLGLLTFRKHDLSTDEGRSNERLKRITLTALSGMLSRVISMAVPLITVSLTLNYLGYEIYGLWMAITAFFIFFRFSDFGIGSGLQTKLSRLSGGAKIEEWKKLISNTIILLLFFSIFIFGIFIIIHSHINWSLLFGVNSKVSIAEQIVFAVVFAKILEIPFSLVQRTQLALQQGFESNLWQSFGSLLSLGAVYTITFLDLGNMVLIWSYALITVFVTLINMIVFFCIRRPDLKPNIFLFELKIIKSLFKIGNGFLVLSILTTAGLAFDTFIVARTSSLTDVSIFSIATRVTAIISIAAMMLSNPLWAANGEALARGEYSWVRKMTFKISAISFFATVSSSIIFLVFNKLIFTMWLGPDFYAPVVLLLGLLLMQIILATIAPFFMVLNASGKIKEQVFIFLLFTPIVIVTKYITSSYFSYIYIPLVGSLLYLFIIIPYTYIKATKVLKEEGNKI